MCCCSNCRYFFFVLCIVITVFLFSLFFFLLLSVLGGAPYYRLGATLSLSEIKYFNSTVLLCLYIAHNCKTRSIHIDIFTHTHPHTHPHTHSHFHTHTHFLTPSQWRFNWTNHYGCPGWDRRSLQWRSWFSVCSWTQSSSPTHVM